MYTYMYTYVSAYVYDGLPKPSCTRIIEIRSSGKSSGDLPEIFRKHRFLLLRCWDICWRAGAASFFQPPRMCTNPLSHAIVAIATRNKSGRAHA